MQQIVYISSPESQQIYAWIMNDKGMLTLLQKVNISGQVQPMVVNFKQKILYVGVRPNFGVISFKIEADGTLIKAGEVSLPASPSHLSIDHLGKYLFCSSYNYGCISVSPIYLDGLPKLPSQIINGLNGCHFANIDNYNHILYVTALKQNRIYLFQLDADGYLKEHPQKYVTTVYGSGPRHMSFHPLGEYAYSINELNSTVDVWQLKDTSNKIKCLQNIEMMSTRLDKNFWAADIHILPNGNFLYTCDRSNSTITIFKVHNNGKLLTIQGHQKMDKALQPRGFCIDTTGNFLVVAGQKSNFISVYKISQNCGYLTLIGHYIVGHGPICVVVYNIQSQS
ncbi:6-phosphogluconolactonase [Candidatus Ishikawella capsulata]|uniref:6-phosphogluconolactonase n=1 Tax=Candidatus Ishikawaella capsulata Mpkobe TaxID=476281 RepID=C5WDC5_9ENTR|nr:6-phosphogluconolactonase [Candidatus Ishikawaella capsulata]BAH83331.1 6-phosphogluconolactonase [Candidatus Ishikawaella capsulata Mpkobe]